MITQGKAWEKIKKEVFLSPEIKPVSKPYVGFTIDYWITLKKFYENMSLIRIVDWEGKAFLEITLTISWEYKEKSITHRIHMQQLEDEL